MDKAMREAFEKIQRVRSYDKDFRLDVFNAGYQAAIAHITKRLQEDDVVEAGADAIQVEDAECFPTLNLKQSDYCKRISKAAISAILAKVGE